jgi:hypothetical protein
MNGVVCIANYLLGSNIDDLSGEACREQKTGKRERRGVSEEPEKRAEDRSDRCRGTRGEMSQTQCGTLQKAREAADQQLQ